MIRNALATDSAAICKIYNYYVLNSTFTFEEERVSTEGMTARIEKVIGNGLPWLVYEEDGQIVGYAYATKWKERTAYRFSVETSIYLNHEYSGKGVGSMLYTQLIDILRKENYHTIITGISIPNEKSQRLHEKLGFERIAIYKEAGFKFNKWIDVTNWQLML